MGSMRRISMSDEKKSLKLVQGLSALQTPLANDASNAAAFSSPKNDREMTGEVDVDSYELLAPRGRKRLTKGGFYEPGCFNNSMEDRD